MSKPTTSWTQENKPTTSWSDRIEYIATQVLDYLMTEDWDYLITNQSKWNKPATSWINL